MFENAVSKAKETRGEVSSEIISNIPSSIQTKIILERSRRTWEWLKDSVAQDIEDCSTEDGLRVFRLLDALAVHFRYRLLNHKSEPCALSFTISKPEQDIMDKLNRLIEILRKAQLLYIKSGPSKDDGQIEPYYIPNKILWPARGLDPHGQHARVSIPANVLWEATNSGKIDLLDKQDNRQMELWNEEQ